MSIAFHPGGDRSSNDSSHLVEEELDISAKSLEPAGLRRLLY